MQRIVIEEPYAFVPPYRGRWWPWFLQRFVPGRLRKKHGVATVECVGHEKLKASHAAGHGILLAVNHCRPTDPEVVNELCRRTGVLPFFMASWHIFKQSRLEHFVLRRLGAFSIYREGLDRQAINTAIEILEQGSRPLVVFPEGVISRTNDHLNPLMEGTTFIARAAAKKRAKATPATQVVIHTVAIRYRFDGDIRQAVEPVLTEIEKRLSWRPQNSLGLDERVVKLGHALLALKEIEFLGQPQTGDLRQRLGRLIEALLAPLEDEWLKGDHDGHVVTRVKKLRSALLPEMIQGKLPDTERERRWRHLGLMYLAQQLSCYPPDYLDSKPTPERLLETVERFEEDLNDACRVHRPLHAQITVGDAIVVSTGRERGEDPILAEIECQLKSMLGISP